MSKLEANLKLFGLKEGEITTYLFLLSNRDLPAYKIATGTNIPRTTVYKHLESLEKQGLVSKWSKNSVKHFSAENPKRLEQLLNFKKEALNNILPELTSKFNNESIYPTAKLYTGKEGVKYAFEHILETIIKEKLKLVYAISEKKLTETLPKFFLDWRERKNKKTGAFTYMIVSEGTASHQHYKSDPFRETREMPQKNLLEGSLNIIGNNVYFFSFKEEGNEIYSLVIESPIVASMMTKLFLYIWKTLE
ncbi:MAG: hypothetical protein RLZZ517_516 [Candidatus Parcubacteria bacterium]|jgi:sugar-specific transcriptional regulator TrmB